MAADFWTFQQKHRMDENLIQVPLILQGCTAPRKSHTEEDRIEANAGPPLWETKQEWSDHSYLLLPKINSFVREFFAYFVSNIFEENK